MFKIFLKNNPYINDVYPIKKYSKWDYIKRRYNDEFKHIIEYYRYERERAVPNTHILGRLIQNLSPSIELDDFDYYKSVATNARFLSKQFDITSNIHPGKVFENIFYGKNSKEILLYVENDIELEELSETWENLTPVRPIYTQDTDMDFYIPMGDKELDTWSLSVYEIDIVMMLMQYKYWANWRIKNDSSTNPNVFVAMYVIPNMVYNMMELALFNRFINLANDSFIDEFDIKHPFAVLDYSKGIDNILLKIKKDLKGGNIPIVQLLKTIPSFVSDNIYPSLIINHNLYTRQSEWSMWLARLEYITNIINILGKQGIKRNRDVLNILPVMVKALENRSTDLEGKIKNDKIELDIDYYIETIKEKIGRR